MARGCFGLDGGYQSEEGASEVIGHEADGGEEGELQNSFPGEEEAYAVNQVGHCRVSCFVV